MIEYGIAVLGSGGDVEAAAISIENVAGVDLLRKPQSLNLVLIYRGDKLKRYFPV